MKIGIVGQGYVGTAIKVGFEPYYELETYDNEVWKYLKCIQISNNLFKYEKIDDNKLLIFSDDETIFKKYVY